MMHTNGDFDDPIQLPAQPPCGRMNECSVLRAAVPIRQYTQQLLGLETSSIMRGGGGGVNNRPHHAGLRRPLHRRQSQPPP